MFRKLAETMNFAMSAQTEEIDAGMRSVQNFGEQRKTAQHTPAPKLQ